MKGKMLQKQLLQFVMLSLLSVVSVLVMSGESFAMDCTSCHGTSTVSIRPIDSPTGTRDIATGAFKGSHEKHLVAAPADQTACNVCHNNTGYTNSHRDGQIKMAAGVGYGKPLFFNQTSVPTLSSCSAASCHNPFTNGTPKVTPVWGTASDCNSCHENPQALGAHTKHLAVAGVDCSTCHTSPGAAGHVDGNISVSQGYPASVPKHVSGTYTQTCTTAACHNTGRSPIVAPVWSVVNPACTTCHLLQPTTGSHTKHVANPTGSSALVACGACHAGAVEGLNAGTHHLDTLINFSAGKAVSKAKGSAFATCNTVYCHSTVQANGGIGAPVYSTVTWGGAAICGSCHDAAPVTGSHTKHMITGIDPLGTGLTACVNCHTAYGTSTHADGTINIITTYSQAGTPRNGYGTCSTASCHDAGRGSAITPVWGTPAPACTACHALVPATGSHVKHVTGTLFATVACGTCHNGAVQGSNAGTAHIDGNIDTIATLGYPQNKAKGSAFATCATTYCHSNVQPNGGVGAPTYKPVTWGDTSTGCDFCHAAQPTTGTHSKHIAKDATCTNCHSAATSATHVDGSVNVGGAKVLTADYSGTPAPGNAYGSCSTSTCHTGSGLFPAKPATWGGTLDCAGCHSFPPATAYHTGITSNCNSCHPDVSSGTVATTTITVPGQHMDGIVQGGKCDACHGYPPVLAMSGTKGTIVNYSGAKLQNYPGGGGVHDVAGHLSLTIRTSEGFTPCLTCHPDASLNKHNQGFGTFSTWRVQVAVADKFKFNSGFPIVYTANQRLSTAATGSCTNVSCHFQASPKWATDK